MESFLERLLAGHSDTPAPSCADERACDNGPSAPEGEGPLRGPGAPRIAVYDTLTSPPRVITVEEADLPALIGSLATETYRHCREQGGQVPYTVIRELIENLIHASFQDVVVTVLDGGQVLRISDHGPGIADKARAVQPGFTTATAAQRHWIRGVGSGLPIAQESLAFLRGVLTIEDNLGGGTVLTIRLPHKTGEARPPSTPAEPAVRLTTRQKRMLVLLMELGAAGPTPLAKELEIAPATAFRELGILERAGLVRPVGDGKRVLTEGGVSLLESIL